MNVEIRIADPSLALTGDEREHILAEAAGCGADRAEVALSGDGSELEVRYVRSAPRFERIRRITGYLFLDTHEKTDRSAIGPYQAFQR